MSKSKMNANKLDTLTDKLVKILDEIPLGDTARIAVSDAATKVASLAHAQRICETVESGPEIRKLDGRTVIDLSKVTLEIDPRNPKIVVGISREQLDAAVDGLVANGGGFFGLPIVVFN